MANLNDNRTATLRPRIRKPKARSNTMPPADCSSPVFQQTTIQPHVSLVFNEHGHASVHTDYAFVKQIYESPASPGVVDLYRHTESGHEIVVKRSVKKRMCSLLQANSAVREVDLHRTISHGHIVSCLASGENEDEFLIAMEFVADYDYFHRRLEEFNKPYCVKPDGGVDKLRSFTFDILSALEYLHSTNIVHLDLKPANLLLDRNVAEGEYPLVKLCDFGLSRKLDASGNACIEKRCGTEPYIAPEVRDHAVVTAATDMWSFGMLLYQLAVGFVPNALKWRPGEPLPSVPRYWRKYQSTGLLDLIDRCLKLNPTERITATAALQHPWFVHSQ